ncbi:MAG: ATP-binding protein [Acidobacteria bacterium]|nr:MAG: ATP-binding protein [Acidobacteriota bacterium]
MTNPALKPPKIVGETLEMKVANMTFMLERLAQDCAPLQFIRELTENAIQGVQAVDGGRGEIRWDFDRVRYELEPKEGYKLAVIDTGIGMTGPEMVEYINQLSSSMHAQSKHGNFGMGAKIAAAPRSTHGLVYLSWKNGQGSMIHLWKDPTSGAYGLRRHPNGEFWLQITDDIKPDPIKGHGTAVIMLGNNYDENTMNAPPEAQIPSRWITRYLNGRYFRFPEGVTVKARENWSALDDSHNMLRKVTGMEDWLKKNSSESGVLKLKDAKALWWILKDKVDDSGSHPANGHCAALYDDELYEMTVGHPGVIRLQSFGVIFGYNKVVIYVAPTQNESGGLTANTARTQLLVSGQPLPWAEWCAEFRENMPDPISRLIDRVAAGAGSTESAASIRERLKQIRDLFKFSRYRPASSGKFVVEDDFTNAGGMARRDGAGAAGSGAGGSSQRGNGGRAGDIYSLFAGTGTTPAEEVAGLFDPQVKWVSVKDGSRTRDFLEDRAAKYLALSNTIQANADFRVFTDMTARWCRQYGHVPSAEPVIESVVREWFQQQLVEAVLGALALRRSGNWSEQEIEQLWSEEALTSAVLPRYHIDERVKRALGGKLGTLKDREASTA